MARVTIEDCVDKVPNRFDLVMLASHRAREISAGSAITVDRDNDKTQLCLCVKLQKKLKALMICVNA